MQTCAPLYVQTIISRSHLILPGNSLYFQGIFLTRYPATSNLYFPSQTFLSFFFSHPDNDNLFQPPKPEPRSRFFSTRIFWFHSFCPGSTLLSSFGFHLLLLLRTIILLTSSLLLYFTFLVPMPSIFLFYCCCNKLQIQWFRTRQTYFRN